MSDWHETRNGNYVYELDSGKVMTVFERGGWRGAHDGHFTVAAYGTAEEAMKVMEAAVLHGDDGLIEAPLRVPTGWRATKAGGWFRQYRGRQASVKLAKSGKWYVLNGSDLVPRRWFDTAEAAKRYADGAIFSEPQGWG